MRKLFYAMSTSEQEVLIKTEMDLINEYNVDAHFKRAMLTILRQLCDKKGLGNLE
jgi:hypothetical protein